MSKKYFCNKQFDELACDVKYIKLFMKESGIKELKVSEAEIDRDSGYFFCNEFLQVGEKNGTCGRACEKYNPRNKKSGICTHYGHVYSDGKEITIKIK